MRIIPIKSLNKNAAEPESFVNFSEDEYRLGIVDAALSIIQANKEAEKPIVLITGPSGSGKTVTAHRLKAELTALGAATHIISMDNYFKPIIGSIDGVDLESPDRVDRELFAEQAQKIMHGEEITLPVFDFKRQDRDWGGKFKREKNELVIFEGIHMLNPLISGCLAGHASSVYVSVRTRIKSAQGHSMHPSKIRLMRRFVRDKLFRARSFFQTMEHFNNVQRGEKKHIMPFKKHAEFDIDTFVPYETNIYKKHIFAELEAAENKNSFIYELLMFLEELENIDDEFVPETSLVREFIGGNTLMY
jgi:uridine kinase